MKTVMSHDWALQMHGLYADTEKNDVVISLDINRKEAVQTLYSEVGAMYPDYELMIITDVDVAD